jgi:hypothetical protein
MVFIIISKPHYAHKFADDQEVTDACLYACLFIYAFIHSAAVVRGLVHVQVILT